MYKKELKQYIWQDLLIGTFAVIMVFLLQEVVHKVAPGIFSNLMGISIDENLCVNIIITQYTITFLIVSLLSLLSGSGEYIYWVDVLEQKIISPRHLNFTSMSVYAFISMFAGSIAFLRGKSNLVLLFFAADVILLVFLTFRMTSVYFGKERLRRKLYSKIEKDIKKYLDAPDSEQLKAIEDKLNGVYENATKLAEKKQFGEILETDFQLLIDISEMMSAKYNNDLAKIVYGNITKILLIFNDSSDYIFSRLNTKYCPFSNHDLQTHTVEMLQGALACYFEKVLSDENYQSSQNFWISGIYRNLNKSYLTLLEQLNSTVVITDTDYHNYEGEVLFHHEERKLDSLELLEIKCSVIHEKILRFSKLIYKNSPELFFIVVNEHGMAIDIMKEIDLLGLICENDRLKEAVKTCTCVTDKYYLLGVQRYIETYYDYDMTEKISRANGDTEFYKKLIAEIKEKSYTISSNYKQMVNKAAFVKNSPVVAKALLFEMNQMLIKVCRIMNQHMEKVQQGRRGDYGILFNDDTYDALVYHVQMKDPVFLKMLKSICDKYPEETELCMMAKGLIKLFEHENNMLNYKEFMNSYAISLNASDQKNEWVWGIDRLARERRDFYENLKEMIHPES